MVPVVSPHRSYDRSMPPATFDHPLPYRSAIPAQRGLNVLTAGTFVALVAVQFAWWPALFGSILPSVTVALATPLLALVPSGMIIAGLRRREMRAWSRAHGFVHHRRPRPEIVMHIELAQRGRHRIAVDRRQRQLEPVGLQEIGGVERGAHQHGVDGLGLRLEGQHVGCRPVGAHGVCQNLPGHSEVEPPAKDAP